MDSENTVKGNCLTCDFFRDNECRKAGTMLSQITDPICLAKLNVILLQDIASMLEEHIYGDED
jgi:hypothetical protein